MAEMKRVVILGAGYAGMEAAKVLNKRLKKNSNIEITLIDKNSYHTLMTELHEIAGHRTPAESVMVDIDKVFRGTKVNFCQDEIEGIDFKNRILKSEKSSYSYDYLILGVGAEPNDFGVEGVKENAFTVWSLKQALEIREHVESMFDKARHIKDEAKRKQMLTFVVAGAGFTGIEVVGELMDWKKVLCNKYGINRSEVTIVNVEAMPHILPILSPKLRVKAMRYMKRRNVEVLVNSSIDKVEKNAVHIKGGNTIKSETIIWTCGVQANSFCVGKGFLECKAHRIGVNDYLEADNYEGVYAIGDNAYYEIGGKAIPQIVETALQTGACAAKNIANEIENKAKEKLKLETHGFMVSIGSQYCVAEVVGMKLSGFLAMAMKHMVNLHYLWEVGGLRLIWNYLRHEFFDIQNRRSFIGGHLEGKMTALWAVPLRLFLGYMWLSQGIKKIQENWLVPSINKIAPSPSTAGSVNQATEAVSSASQQAGNPGVEAATGGWDAPIFRKPPGFYQWFTDNVVSPNYYLFQVTIVCMEILIGLALIGGLFVFIASIASLGLVSNFIISGMTNWDILWYIFATIAVMTGSSRVFGLDYYAIPWIKSWWSKTKLARRSQLYFD